MLFGSCGCFEVFLWMSPPSVPVNGHFEGPESGPRQSSVSQLSWPVLLPGRKTKEGRKELWLSQRGRTHAKVIPQHVLTLNITTDELSIRIATQHFFCFFFGRCPQRRLRKTLCLLAVWGLICSPRISSFHSVSGDMWEQTLDFSHPGARELSKEGKIQMVFHTIFPYLSLFSLRCLHMKLLRVTFCQNHWRIVSRRWLAPVTRTEVCLITAKTATY